MIFREDNECKVAAMVIDTEEKSLESHGALEFHASLTFSYAEVERL